MITEIKKDTQLTKILLIEDNPGDVRLIREMLAEMPDVSFELESAGRLSTGLKCLAKKQPDIVLLDLGLPDSQGLETLSKTYNLTKAVPIVVLTGLDDETVGIEAVRQGAQDYLIKGQLNGRALWRVIRYAIARKQIEEKLRDSERRLKEAQTLGRIGNWEFDLATQKLEWSDEVYELYGRDKTLGPPSAEEEALYYSPEETKRLREFARIATETGQERKYDLQAKLPSGKTAFFNATMRPVMDDKGHVVKLFGTVQDITERKQAKKTLLFTRLILDNAADTMTCVDKEGRFVDVNNAFCHAIGYSREELLSMRVQDIDPEHSDEVWSEFWKKLKQSGSLTFESHHRSKEGRIFPIEGMVNYFEYEGKEYHCGFARDITERKKAEEALQQSEAKYRAILKEMADSYFEVDLAGNLTFVNDATCHNLSYSREELLEMSYRGFTAKESIKSVYQVFNEVYRTGKPNKGFSWKILRKDGSAGFVDASASPMVDNEGKIIGFRGVGRDVTERKQAEEILGTSEAKYRNLVEQAWDAIFVIDASGKILMVNQQAYQTSGYTEEELLQLNIADTYPVEQRGVVAKRIATAQLGQPLRYDRPMLRKDGTTILVEVNIGMMPGGLIQGIVRDITERKLLEAERNEIEQKAELASRLASIGEMASGIAHEINNPLTGVIGYAQLLSKKDLPEDIKEGIEVINDGAQRVAGIIKRLLTFARQYKPERTLVNINDIIETTLSLRVYHLKTGNIKLTTRLAPDLPTTIADAGQLQQVFLNLIVNAETEMKQAHGEGKLSVMTEQMDNIIRISFKDDGPGIMKKNVERIFNPFFTTRKVGEGTGLGLSVCHGIIAEHGGRIYAESKLGRGATFIIELPMITADEQMELPELIAEEPQKVTNARILVIDDEPGVRQFLGQVLTDEGHEVQTVDNASDALERIKSQRYNLILLDIKMPDMSGIELYERIHEISRSLAGRVVFITGDVLGINTAAFLSKTKAPHIVKPFDAEQLNKDISRILTEGARGWARRHGKAQV